MTKREYHADGLDFVRKMLVHLLDKSEQHPPPTFAMLTNGVQHLVDAAKFLREEQRAIELVFERDDRN